MNKIDPIVNHSKFSNVEDICILKHIQKEGYGNWKTIIKEL